eukprot:876494_1
MQREINQYTQYNQAINNWIRNQKCIQHDSVLRAWNAKYNVLLQANDECNCRYESLIPDTMLFQMLVINIRRATSIRIEQMECETPYGDHGDAIHFNWNVRQSYNKGEMNIKRYA